MHTVSYLPEEHIAENNRLFSALYSLNVSPTSGTYSEIQPNQCNHSKTKSRQNGKNLFVHTARKGIYST
jgi:hypothetical protein